MNYGMDKGELDHMQIKATILSDKEMRDIGFTNHAEDRWYFCRRIKFPNTKQYRGLDITFNLTIPKDGSDIQIDILDEDFLQPYDYQYILENNPKCEPCLIVKEQVEEWIKYLQNSGVLSGHI